MPSRWPGVERAKPLLGTRVAVRVHGLAPKMAHAAIDAAFAEIADIHRLMSFHEPHSDVSRLNREAHRREVDIDPRTHAVLERAFLLAQASGGVFDVTVAPCLVSRGVLPPPADACRPDPAATWRDVVLSWNNSVRFHKPLWIDLGGIAKGWAVDRAMEALSEFSPLQACVNAGGDLCVAGPDGECVRLAPDEHDRDSVPVMEIANGAVASSCGSMAGRRRSETSAHVDTLHDRAFSRRIFASVIAPNCTAADGLTKVVMARGWHSAPVLEQFDARAVVYTAKHGWHEIGGPV